MIIASWKIIDDWRALEEYKHKFDPDFRSVNLKSFHGYYLYKQFKIPVLSINSEVIDKNILILNKSRLGTLRQYLYENDDSQKPEMFKIEIKSFSENAELLNNCLDNPPDWLLEKGTRQQQREYLEQRVAITITENFEFRKHPDFQGYIIPVENLVDDLIDNV